MKAAAGFYQEDRTRRRCFRKMGFGFFALFVVRGSRRFLMIGLSGAARSINQNLKPKTKNLTSGWRALEQGRKSWISETDHRRPEAGLYLKSEARSRIRRKQDAGIFAFGQVKLPDKTMPRENFSRFFEPPQNRADTGENSLFSMFNEEKTAGRGEKIGRKRLPVA